MSKFEIELFEPMVVEGQARPAGWIGVCTQAYAKLAARSGKGRIVRAVLDAPAPKAKAKAKK